MFINLYLFPYQFFYLFIYLYTFIYLCMTIHYYTFVGWLGISLPSLKFSPNGTTGLGPAPPATGCAPPATAPGHLPAGLCAHLSRFFALPTSTWNFASKKCRKNAKNRRFSPPKTVPKPFRNPSKFVVPGKMWNFTDFVRILWLVARAVRQNLCAQPMFCWLFTQCSFLLSARTSAPKNLPKTLPKRHPNHCKTEAENVLLFNIDFFGFGPRFWSLLGLHVGATLRILAYFSAFRPSPHCPPTVRRRPKGLRARFWRLRAWIFEVLWT